MRRLLLIVEARFLAPSRGLLLVTPWLIAPTATDSLRTAVDVKRRSFPRAPMPRPTQLEARRPDGSTLRVACRFADTHLNYRDHHSDEPPGWKPSWVVTCGLVGAREDDVPPGTQLWYETEDEADESEGSRKR